jgi:predicted ATPase with chaperone activity
MTQEPVMEPSLDGGADQVVVLDRPDWGSPPPIPETLAETGLSAGFVGDLLVKVLHVRGSATGAELADIIRLPFIIIEEVLLELVQRRLIEVRGGSVSRANYVFDLTSAGEERAHLELSSSRYAGPAPITLEHYGRLVAQQSVHDVQLSRERVRDGFAGMVLDSDFLDRLGPAINSARSLFLYGEAGNGKTMIAETIASLMGDAIYVPHAVLVEGEIMMVYDPAYHHEPAAAPAGTGETSIWRNTTAHDARFLRVRRPMVLTGGELTLEQLEMNFETTSRIYQAPAQVKANGGVLILDDFGRQRVPSRVLLNRWMVPLERRRDLLALHTGTKFPVPFDCLVIFATNLEPSELVEEAFLRRIRYKIAVNGPTPEQYTEIFRRACAHSGIPFHQDAVRYIYTRFYERQGIEPRACHPRDVVDHIADVARYMSQERALTPELIERACESYFLTGTRADPAGSPAAAPA